MWVGVRWWRCCCYSCWLHALSLLFDHSPAHSMMCVFQAMEFLNLRQHKHQMHKSALWYRYHFRANLKVELVVLCLCRFFLYMQILYSIGGYNSVCMAKWKKLLFYFSMIWFEQSRHPNAFQLTFGYYFAHRHIGILGYWNASRNRDYWISIFKVYFRRMILRKKTNIYFINIKKRPRVCQWEYATFKWYSV